MAEMVERCSQDIWGNENSMYLQDDGNTDYTFAKPAENNSTSNTNVF